MQRRNVLATFFATPFVLLTSAANAFGRRSRRAACDEPLRLQEVKESISTVEVLSTLVPGLMPNMYNITLRGRVEYDPNGTAPQGFQYMKTSIMGQVVDAANSSTSFLVGAMTAEGTPGPRGEGWYKLQTLNPVHIASTVTNLRGIVTCHTDETEYSFHDQLTGT